MTTAYLTLDDAPSATLPELVARLEDRDVPALFFCEGRRLAEYPDHAQMALEAGFHLGNHAYSHKHASELSVETFDAELERTESLLEEVYDAANVCRPAKLFRFPFGDKGDEHATAFQDRLAADGFVSPDPDLIEYEWYRTDHGEDRDWFWTVDVADWTVDSPAELDEKIAARSDRLESESADIVLFHDAGNTPDLTAHFVDRLLERGLEFEDPLSLVA
ncbi:polysaccharide deacetylase family protein [Natronolimnobius sp. AArcel1]|uniref:polysaccharide deacetylase family protein n=1 Tax=Natronolimnobius sp. AArcel1 TaxID=1679093 RepID=UPI0013E9D33A|nr:polysaccharide deacetylase family protein [Natronolimnobius sp. AArcel1]NGM71177.1 polysaccharide deacetylase family protein [Natronolimnobius sp. AArcel1]